LWSQDYYNQKTWQRVRDSKDTVFENWAEAKERYIAEKIEPLLDTYRQSDHDWFKSWSRRKGEVMHSSDLIFRLQKLNPHLQIQSQINFPEDWGLYSAERGRIQFITGLPKGWMTEWSYSIVDDRNLPTEERRGWRTVVVYALLKGALSWDQVMAEFGDPSDGWNDYRWQEVTLEFRHGGEQMAQRNIGNLLEP
jgi:hypothetical protein